jgi:hypothetical protein
VEWVRRLQQADHRNTDHHNMELPFLLEAGVLLQHNMQTETMPSKSRELDEAKHNSLSASTL